MTRFSVFSNAYLLESFEVYPANKKPIYADAEIYFSGAPLWMQKNGNFIKTVGMEIQTRQYKNPENVMLMGDDIFNKLFGNAEKAKDFFLIIRNKDFIRSMGLGHYDYS